MFKCLPANSSGGFHKLPSQFMETTWFLSALSCPPAFLRSITCPHPFVIRLKNRDFFQSVLNSFLSILRFSGSWNLHSFASFGKFLRLHERISSVSWSILHAVLRGKPRKMQDYPSLPAPSCTPSYTLKTIMYIDILFKRCRMCRRKLRKNF